jgi:hypothetical protein
MKIGRESVAPARQAPCCTRLAAWQRGISDVIRRQFRGRHVHRAEEGMQRQFKAPRRPRDLPFDVERNVDVAGGREIFGKRAHQRYDEIVPPILAKRDVEDANLKRCPGRAPTTAIGPVRIWPGAMRSPRL